jgi:hypothetical protein
MLGCEVDKAKLVLGEIVVRVEERHNLHRSRVSVINLRK